jgi:hypothetical protein
VKVFTAEAPQVEAVVTVIVVEALVRIETTLVYGTTPGASM